MSHVHQTLDLPNGYQHFSWYREGANPGKVFLNDMKALRNLLKTCHDQELRLYTQHQIVYEDGILKQTRSSPNWDGGVVTYSTCKHLMRTYKENWVGTWIAGLCPAECCNNCLLFAGCVAHQFGSNYDLMRYCKENYNGPAGGPWYRHKMAISNPRGDLYSDLPTIMKQLGKHNHLAFVEPGEHTRSVEFYKKSPGSKSLRKDGLIPKWWRDIEYLQNGKRPPSFILSPCFLFSKPLVWSTYNPGRAALKLTTAEFLASLVSPGNSRQMTDGVSRRSTTWRMGWTREKTR